MNSVQQTPYQLLKTYFKIKVLNKVYNEKIRFSVYKGIDRINGIQFQKQTQLQLKVIHNKSLRGTYRFSPYLELLQSKGRGKNPRVIAIPSVRDRIVLHILKQILFEIFPDCVPRKLANTYIYEIRNFVKDKNPNTIKILYADIENFYGSIDRNILLTKLSSKIKSKKLLTLIKRAIETPIVPKNYKKRELSNYVECLGIPQGLAISNILAAIYLSELDKTMKDTENIYIRYVDDILIFTDVDKINESETILKTKIAELKLGLHPNKTGIKTGEEEFDYLGYHFELPKVTVKQSTVDNFILSISAKFSSYIHSKNNKLKKYKYLTEEKLKEIFVSDLNEKITGAINENRRYGWIFYFGAINDLTILYNIDNIIKNLFSRLEDFNRVAPSEF